MLLFPLPHPLMDNLVLHFSITLFINRSAKWIDYAAKVVTAQYAYWIGKELAVSIVVPEQVASSSLGPHRKYWDDKYCQHKFRKALGTHQYHHYASSKILQMCPIFR